MQNYLKSVLKLIWVVIAILLLLSFIPLPSSIKPVRLLSDLLPHHDVEHDIAFGSDEITDALNQELEMLGIGDDDFAEETDIYTAASSSDSRLWESDQIIDYGYEEKNNMGNLLVKLAQSASSHTPVRIAYFGDSYFTTDAFSATLRESLQQEYGGSGIGYVSVTPTNKRGYRPPIYHLCKGWRRYAVNVPNSIDQAGISGYYFKPADGAEVFAYGLKGYASLLGSSDQFSLYFNNQAPIQLGIALNNGPEKKYNIPAGKGLNQLNINAHVDSVRWRVLKGDKSTFYGMAMDGKSGVSLDDISTEDSNGTHLRNIPKWWLKDFNKMRPYDLVILQYGSYLPRNTNLANYKRKMNATIAQLKANMPNATFLLISAGSQAQTNRYGQVSPVPYMAKIVECQQEIAEENNIAFWNLFHTMGGEAAMQNLSQDNKTVQLNDGSMRLNVYESINLAKRFIDALKDE